MRFTDLVFDLYGTLVDIHTVEDDLVWEKTALFFGFHGAHYTPEQLHLAFDKAMTAREAKAGQSYECFPDIPFEQVMAELFCAKGIVDGSDSLGFQAAQLFRIASIEYIRLYRDAREALAKLHAAGFRLWLLSNAQAVFTAYELRLLGLDDCFDGILLSSDYGCRKPDIRFYQALMSQYALSPSHCLMIGNDRETDIAGARRAGMATLYMHTALTPSHQASAAAPLSPEHAPVDALHYEFEGDDWSQLVNLIMHIAK